MLPAAFCFSKNNLTLHPVNLKNKNQTTLMKLFKVSAAILFCIVSFCVNAQTVSGVKPDPTKAMGVYSDWTKSDVTFEDGSTATIEYRLALITRKGIACHYDFEVKNTSSANVKVKLKSSYSDKLVKGLYHEEVKESLKAGKSVVARFIAQGCKKDKGAEELEPYAQCMACSFFVDITVSK